MQSRIHRQHISLIKTISICVLTLPLFLLIVFNPISHESSLRSKLSMKNILFGLDKWFELLPEIQSIQSALDMTIEQNKFVVNKQQHSSCPMYTKLSSQSIIAEDQIKCAQIEQSYPEIIYVHVLIEQYQQKEQLQLINAQLQKYIPQLRIEIIAEMLDTSVLPHHIKDKIHDQDYIKYIGNQISQLRFGKHCRYTYKKCQNWVIFLAQWASLQNQYVEVGKLLFTHPNNLQQAVIRCIAGQSTSVSKFNQLIKLNQLFEIKKQLTYLKDLLSNHMINANTGYAHKYISQIRDYLNGTNGTDIDRYPRNKILNEQKSIQVDIFPTQYKIGIYLPLILIIIGFPCFSIAKL